MNTVIAMKDLRLKLAKIADRVEQGATFMVIRRSKPSFFLSPIQRKREKKSYTLKNFSGLVKRGNLAKNIDRDLYA